MVVMFIVTNSCKVAGTEFYWAAIKYYFLSSLSRV